MLRRLTRLLMWLFWRGLLVGALAFVVALLSTHYLFQEPAHVTWRRLLNPEIYWQRQKYPSVRFAFDILDKVLVDQDPRDRLTMASRSTSSQYLVEPQERA